MTEHYFQFANFLRNFEQIGEDLFAQAAPDEIQTFTKQEVWDMFVEQYGNNPDLSNLVSYSYEREHEIQLLKLKIKELQNE